MRDARTGRDISSTTLASGGKAFDKREPATSSVVLSGDGSHAFGQLGTEDQQFCRQIDAWDVATGKDSFPATGHESSIATLMFQSDGSLLSLARDGMIIHWDHKGDEVQHRRYPGMLTDGASLTEDGRVIAPRDTWQNYQPRPDNPESWAISIYDLSKYKPLHEIPQHGLANVRLAFSPGKNTLAIARDASLSLHFLNDQEEAKFDTKWSSVPDGGLFPRGPQSTPWFTHRTVVVLLWVLGQGLRFGLSRRDNNSAPLARSFVLALWHSPSMGSNWRCTPAEMSSLWRTRRQG